MSKLETTQPPPTPNIYCYDTYEIEEDEFYHTIERELYKLPEKPSVSNVLWQNFVQNSRQETPDFAIKFWSLSYKVHKSVLSSRSEYFNTLFTSPYSTDFKENKQNELEFDDPDLWSDECMRALLSIIYTDDFSFDSEVIMDCKKSDIDCFKPASDVFGWDLGYYTQLSELADRFLVRGVDDLIAQKIFTRMNMTVSKPPDLRYRQQPEALVLHVQDAFHRALETIWQNACRHGSERARDIMASFLNEYLWSAKLRPYWHISQRNLDGLEGLKAKMRLDLINRPLRLMCPTCLVVTREVCRRDEDAHIQHCERCGRDAPFDEWVCMFHKGLKEYVEREAAEKGEMNRLITRMSKRNRMKKSAADEGVSEYLTRIDW